MKKRSELILTWMVGAASLISVALLWRHNLILLLTLLFLAALMLLIKRSKRELKTFIFCGFLGGAAEVLAIFFGTWTYANPNLFNIIPAWLFILWGIASIFVIRIFLSFKK